jgi:LPXTG-motif cell wall-anchored protein
MPGRHRSPAAPPSNATRRLGAVGLAGFTGLAAAFATAGGAHADPAPPTPHSSSTPTAPGRDTPIGAPKGRTAPTPGKSATPETRKAPMQGNFGTGKIRVGVKIKPGVFVPDGTTTVGSEITIVETGDGVDGGTETTTCDTDASTVQAGSTASYCVWDNQFQETDDYYLTEPGDSVSITQTTVNPNLVIDSSDKTFGPCDGNDETGFCDPVTALFVDPALPPNAVNDFAKTKANVSVTIDVLNNDQPGEPGAPLTITNSTEPKHGTATLNSPPGKGSGKAAPTTQTFVYDPDHNFTGVDHFHYTIETPNGHSTALVTVNVTAPPPVARNNHAQTQQGKSVTISVENNDSARYPHTKITLVSVGHPKHGTARIDGNQIIYTPVDGFSGTDKFPYKISTPFGTATAEVTVVIPAAPTTSPPPSGPIAVTGTDVSTSLDIAIGLLLAGGALAVVGRRRRRSGGHA